MSCVSSGVRHAWLALALVIAVAPVARAEDAPDEDDDDASPYVPLARHSIAVGFLGHGTRIAGVSESGGGPVVELALGIGRWQPFAEAMIASAGASSWTAPATDMRVDGWMGRGGLGIRWLARQFAPDDGGAFELYLQAFAGVERFWWHDGTRLLRPDVGVGLGTQIRVFAFHDLTMRLDARVLFTPADRDGMWVSCRGACPSSSQDGSASGFMTGIEVAW